MAQIFTDILNQGRMNMQNPGVGKSRQWFRDKASEVGRINATNLISNHPTLQKTVVRPGFMYLYSYDAKHKDTLPYYDMYPLVFPFSADATGFTGINLHYLPPILRARLMDSLYDLSAKKEFDEKTKLNLSYRILLSSSKYKYFAPCVKRYLYSQLRTRFLLIPSNEWDIALFLPLEKFNASKSLVYRDSNAIMRKS